MATNMTRRLANGNRPAVATKPSGTFKRIGPKMVSFTPSAMPPRLRLDSTLIRRIILAERSLAELNALGSRLVNPQIITRPYITREASASSKISGVPATAEDVMRYEATGHTTAAFFAEMKMQELLNCMDAITYCMGRIQKGSEISVTLIRETHRVLMGGSKEAGAGDIRRTTKMDLRYGTSAGADIVMPTDPNNVRPLLNDMLVYVSRDGEVSRLVQCAFMQYQFNTISPFRSGNGRVARILAMAYLYKYGLISGHFLYPSSYHERRHVHYRQKTEGVMLRSRWREWLLYFLDAIIAQSKEAVATIENLSALRVKYKSSLKNPNASDLVDMLLSNPYITISGASAAQGIGYTAAKNAVGDLMAHGVLDRADMALRNKLFRASEIVNVQGNQVGWEV